MFLFFAFAGTQVANIGSGETAENSTTGSTTGFNSATLLYISLCFGFSLMVNAWVFFRISGGLFNPAVMLHVVSENHSLTLHRSRFLSHSSRHSALLEQPCSLYLSSAGPVSRRISLASCFRPHSMYKPRSAEVPLWHKESLSKPFAQQNSSSQLLCSQKRNTVRLLSRRLELALLFLLENWWRYIILEAR